MKSATLDKRLCLFVWLYLCPFLVLCFSFWASLVEIDAPFWKSTQLCYPFSSFWQDIFDKIRALAVEHFPTRFQQSAILFLHLKANISCHSMFSPFHCLVCFASIGCWIMCQVPLLDDIHNMLMVDTLQHSLVEQSSQQNVWIDGYIWDNMKFPLKFSISSQPGWQAGTIKVTLAMQFW